MYIEGSQRVRTGEGRGDHRGSPVKRKFGSSPDQVQIKWVPLNRSTATSDLKQDQVFAAKRHKIRNVLMFPLLRPSRFHGR